MVFLDETLEFSNRPRLSEPVKLGHRREQRQEHPLLSVVLAHLSPCGLSPGVIISLRYGYHTASCWSSAKSVLQAERNPPA